eukprot:12882368-Prorocentrum_lima.AAC.1
MEIASSIVQLTGNVPEIGVEACSTLVGVSGAGCIRCVGCCGWCGAIDDDAATYVSGCVVVVVERDEE